MSDIFRFQITTKCILYNDSKQILLLKRGDTAPTFPGYWDLPGGFIDETDDPQVSIQREILEETGQTVSQSQIVGLIKFLRKEIPTICILYSGNLPNIDNKIEISYEHSAYQFVSKSELGNYQIQPWLKEYLVAHFS